MMREKSGFVDVFSKSVSPISVEEDRKNEMINKATIAMIPITVVFDFRKLKNRNLNRKKSREITAIVNRTYIVIKPASNHFSMIIAILILFDVRLLIKYP